MTRRTGRYTKEETANLIKMFNDGYSTYKICRNLNRSQKSIRNNLIRLGLIEGEITPKRYKRVSQKTINEMSLTFTIFNHISYLIILSVLSFMMLVNPLLNPLQMFIEGILVIIF